MNNQTITTNWEYNTLCSAMSPEAWPNTDSISATSVTSSLIGFRKIAVSSAYMLTLIFVVLCWIGDNCSLVVATSNIFCNGSMAKIKSNGDRGLPCRSSCQCLNQSPLDPLRKTADVEDPRRIDTHDLHHAPNPICVTSSR